MSKDFSISRMLLVISGPRWPGKIGIGVWFPSSRRIKWIWHSHTYKVKCQTNQEWFIDPVGTRTLKNVKCQTDHELEVKGCLCFFLERLLQFAFSFFSSSPEPAILSRKKVYRQSNAFYSFYYQRPKIWLQGVSCQNRQKETSYLALWLLQKLLWYIFC